MTEILGRNRTHPARSSVSYRQQGHPCSGKRGCESGERYVGLFNAMPGRDLHEAMAAGREEHVGMCCSGIAGLFNLRLTGRKKTMVGERLLVKTQYRGEMADATLLACPMWQVGGGPISWFMHDRSVRCGMIRAVTRGRNPGKSTLFTLIRTTYCSRQINTEDRGLLTPEQTANLKTTFQSLGCQRTLWLKTGSCSRCSRGV